MYITSFVMIKKKKIFYYIIIRYSLYVFPQQCLFRNRCTCNENDDDISFRFEIFPSIEYREIERLFVSL